MRRSSLAQRRRDAEDFLGICEVVWKAEGYPMELPALNETVPLERVKAICEHYGHDELWKKIEADPPPKDFVSDGCTGWVNEYNGISIYPACFFHDLKYWAGYPGEEVARLIADAELMIDVARLLKGTKMAETMFHGVRIGGTDKVPTPWAWGFGRRVDEGEAKG